MLKNAKVGAQVTLAHKQMSATITDIAAPAWGKKTYTIKANNGKFAGRKYNEQGQCLSGETKFAVTKLLGGFSEAKAKEVMGYTAAELRQMAADLEAASSAAIDPTEPKEIDFGDGKGKVAAARHLNSDGTYGGYVAETAFVDEDIRVARGSVVFGNAEITGYGRIINNSKVGIDMNLAGDTIDGVTLSLKPLKLAA